MTSSVLIASQLPIPLVPANILSGKHFNQISNTNKQLIIEKYSQNLKPNQIRQQIHPPVKLETIKSIIKRYKRTGNIEAQPKSGRKRKLTEAIVDKIEEIQDNNNEITLQDLRTQLLASNNVNISVPLIHSVLKKQKFSTKQLYANPTRRYGDQTYVERLLWAEEQLIMPQIEKDLTISIDESGFWTGKTRKRGKSRIGKRAIAKVKRVPGEKVNVIAAVSPQLGLVYFEKRLYCTNGESFLQFLDNMYHSNPIFQQQSFRFLMDNPYFHKTEEIKHWFQDHNQVQCFTPIYSPMLNPVEECFAKWKGEVYKQKSDNIDELLSNIDDKAGNITISNCTGWFHHSQSFIPACLNMEEL